MLLTVVQGIELIPLLHDSEARQLNSSSSSVATDPLNSQPSQSHDAQASPPAPSHERQLYTLLTNTIISWGYALVICATMALHHLHSTRPPVTRASGLIWGLAGYIAFYVAPTMAIPPQTPASEIFLTDGLLSLSLPLQKTAWLAVSITTAAGIAGIYYAKGQKKLWGAAVLILPQLLLATLGSELTHSAMHPQHNNLDAKIASITAASYSKIGYITNLLYWLVLGFLCAGFKDSEAKPNSTNL